VKLLSLPFFPVLFLFPQTTPVSLRRKVTRSPSFVYPPPGGGAKRLLSTFSSSEESLSARELLRLPLGSGRRNSIVPFHHLFSVFFSPLLRNGRASSYSRFDFRHSIFSFVYVRISSVFFFRWGGREDFFFVSCELVFLPRVPGLRSREFPFRRRGLLLFV